MPLQLFVDILYWLTTSGTTVINYWATIGTREIRNICWWHGV